MFIFIFWIVVWIFHITWKYRFVKNLASSDRDLPDTNLVVAITSKQSLTISGPGQWQALWWICLWWVSAWDTGTQFFNHLFACQIPDLDWWSVSDAQPVAIRREAQGVDDVIMIQGMQMLSIIQIPQQSLAILSAWSAQWTIRWNSNGVQVSIVAIVIQLQFAVGQIPNLDGTIPASANNDWIDLIGWESNAWNPIAVSIFLDCILALSQSIPQLDGLVAWSRDNLTIVSWECNWKNVLQ